MSHCSAAPGVVSRCSSVQVLLKYRYGEFQRVEQIQILVLTGDRGKL